MILSNDDDDDDGDDDDDDDDDDDAEEKQEEEARRSKMTNSINFCNTPRKKQASVSAVSVKIPSTFRRLGHLHSLLQRANIVCYYYYE